MQIDKKTEAEIKYLLKYIMSPRLYVIETEQKLSITKDDELSYEEWSRSRARYLYEKLFNNQNEN